jgi:hypothetical protein
MDDYLHLYEYYRLPARMTDGVFAIYKMFARF